MGDQALIELANKRTALQAEKTFVDARVTAITARQTALAASIADMTDGIADGGGAAPANTVAPTVTGTARVGFTLTGTLGTWTGAPTPTLTRQWEANNVPIPGATGATYVPVVGDIGKTIKEAVTAESVLGTTTVRSAATAAVIAA